MEQNSSTPVKCIFCDIVLVGRDQFMGHMIHSHELGYEQLKRIWLVGRDKMDTSEYPKNDKNHLVSNNKAQR